MKNRLKALRVGQAGDRRFPAVGERARGGDLGAVRL